MQYERSRSAAHRYLYVNSAVGLNFGEHMHSNLELIFCKSGEMDIKLSGNCYRLSAGQAILVLPNRIHSIAAADGVESLTVIFSADYVKEFYYAVKNCDFSKPVFDFRGADSLEALDVQKVFHCKSVLYELCSTVYESCAPVESERRSDLLVQKITDYLDEHYTQNVTLETLSEALGYSYYYMSDFINSNFKTNFSTLLGGYRVDLALTLLQTTELSITEIADKCGFATIRSFNRAFKRSMGVGPSTFRKGEKQE